MNAEITVLHKSEEKVAKNGNKYRTYVLLIKVDGVEFTLVKSVFE